MGDSFFIYLRQLELIAFFSGYPLLYVVIMVMAGNQPVRNNFKSRMVLLLPFTYAFVGSLFLGLQLKNLYPDYSIENIKGSLQLPFLTAWALLSLVFWLPAIGRRTVLSLAHSLIFFFLLVRDLFQQLSTSSVDKDMIRNDMKIYSISLLLNMGSFAFLVLLSFLFSRYKRTKS